MNKISNEKVAECLRDAATLLRSQRATITELQTKLASRDTRDRVTKIAHEMHRKGLELDTSVEALADRLEKTAAEGKLDAVEQAVDLVGPDMGTKIGFASHNPTSGNSNGDGSTSSSDLERFIIGATG